MPLEAQQHFDHAPELFERHESRDFVLAAIAGSRVAALSRTQRRSSRVRTRASLVDHSDDVVADPRQYTE